MRQRKGQLWLRLADVHGLTFFCSDEHREQAQAMLVAVQASGGATKGRFIKDLLGARVAPSSEAAWELGYLFAIGFANESEAGVIEVSFPGRLSSLELDVESEVHEGRNEGTDAVAQALG